MEVHLAVEVPEPPHAEGRPVPAGGEPLLRPFAKNTELLHVHIGTGADELPPTRQLSDERRGGSDRNGELLPAFVAVDGFLWIHTGAVRTGHLEGVVHAEGGAGVPPVGTGGAGAEPPPVTDGATEGFGGAGFSALMPSFQY